MFACNWSDMLSKALVYIFNKCHLRAFNSTNCKLTNNLSLDLQNFNKLIFLFYCAINNVNALKRRDVVRNTFLKQMLLCVECMMPFIELFCLNSYKHTHTQIQSRRWAKTIISIDNIKKSPLIENIIDMMAILVNNHKHQISSI